MSGLLIIVCLVAALLSTVAVGLEVIPACVESEES